MNAVTPKLKCISMRSQLTGDVVDFCQNERFPNSLCNVLVQLTASLANYREEGISFSPDVFICSDAKRMCSILQGSELLRIGNGPLAEETVKQALRKCAPLAAGGWAIFIEHMEDRINYGLFTGRNMPLSLNPMELLMEGGDPSLPVIAVSQLSENSVELHGTFGNYLQVYFSTARSDDPSPVQPVEELVKAITLSVDLSLLDFTKRFLNRTLNEVLRKTHGTLAVVLHKRRRKLPPYMRDGVVFDTPISLIEKVCQYHKKKNDETMAVLMGVTYLVQGMLMSDGITAFRSDGSIIGYNIFLRIKSSSQRARPILGGSRRRTYESLAEMVPKELLGALIRSQDGRMEYKGA